MPPFKWWLAAVLEEEARAFGQHGRLAAERARQRRSEVDVAGARIDAQFDGRAERFQLRGEIAAVARIDHSIVAAGGEEQGRCVGTGEADRLGLPRVRPLSQ